MNLLACLYKVENRDGTSVLESRNPIETSVAGRLKRRLTPLGVTVTQKLFEMAAINNQDSIPWVVASRHGEGERVGRLLSALATGELVSPTDFSLSVHNAIIGNFSIVTGNKKMYTALSAGSLSFSVGFIEAYALQKESKGRVGYIYYDSPMPKEYDDLIERSETAHVCIALLLGHEENKNGHIEIDFRPEEKNETCNNDILNFINFWEKNANEYKLPVPGGCLYMGRYQH